MMANRSGTAWHWCNSLSKSLEKNQLFNFSVVKISCCSVGLNMEKVLKPRGQVRITSACLSTFRDNLQYGNFACSKFSFYPLSLARDFKGVDQTATNKAGIRLCCSQ